MTCLLLAAPNPGLPPDSRLRRLRGEAQKRRRSPRGDVGEKLEHLSSGLDFQVE